MIPFSPPHIDQQTIDAVTRVLKSGWITTGPVTKQFEKGITDYCQSQSTLCLNSATAGLELILLWFGVKEGDEVILPAYTYAATANVIVHRGATPVFVDVNPFDFNISIKAIEKAITGKTKVIMPVDFAGYPCDYDEIMNLVVSKKQLFTPENEIQNKLGRMLILSDSAHSFGATYKGKKVGALTDITVFSFHAVKNITTAEGGAVALNLPAPFNNEEVYTTLSIKSQHGQNKNAFAKTQRGNWKYDVLEAGYKCNMTDIAAAMGLVELNRYDSLLLIERKRIFKQYDALFSNQKWAELPIVQTADKTGSFHLYTLRIKGITEAQRDAIIDSIFQYNVSVNVHFIPVPMLSYYKSIGYNMNDYPVAYNNYSREISLPVYFDLSPESVDFVAAAVIKAVDNVLNNR